MNVAPRELAQSVLKQFTLIGVYRAPKHDILESM
jgi:hypothetical protein